MKKSIKLMASLAVIGTIAFHTNINNMVQAENGLAAKESYNNEQSVNPDFETMNRLLTETALQYDVPPEIVKAIAERESGGWKHFDENGEAIVTEDNGIGIMQITNQSDYDIDRLKNDIAYNVEAGVQILDRMFDRTDLPSINKKERDVLEHWYFAIMAYNGIKPVNSPIEQETGERNADAYQEEIYQIMADHSLIDITELPFQVSDFQYDPASTQNIKFVTTDYHFNVPFTKTKYSFTTGQKVKATTTGVKVRESATTTSTTLTALKAGDILTVTGPFQYEKDPTGKNHFVWYPVKLSNGTEGFVASSYLKLHFKDVSAGHYASDSIEYLVDRGILAGVGNDQFGMGEPLTRWQAVLLLNRANHVSVGNSPDPGFTDVPKDYLYYHEIAAAVEEGLFGGVSETTFEPHATLTRSQMAVVLQRLYQFPEANVKHPFTDIKADWYADAVSRLYASDITGGVTTTQFGPDQKVTREQFAVFMTRSMEWEKNTKKQ